MQWRQRIYDFCLFDMRGYLDMELKVLIHGVDVVEDILRDARNDALELWVVEVPLCEGRWKQKTAF